MRYKKENPVFCRQKEKGDARFSSAGFIWYPDDKTYFDARINKFTHFRKSFLIGSKAVKADLKIFADSRYMLFINGKYVGRGPCRSDPRWQYYDIVDIAGYLDIGSNVIAILVLYYGYGTGQSISRMPVLLADCDIECEDHSHPAVDVENTWKYMESPAYNSNAPRINGRKGPIEIFDARLAPKEWTEKEFDDSNWKKAGRGGAGAIKYESGRMATISPFWNLVPRSISLLHEEEIQIAGIKNTGETDERPEPDEQIHRQLINELLITEPGNETLKLDYRDFEVKEKPVGKANIITFDFGKVETGYLQLEVSGVGGTVIDVAFAEELYEGKPILTMNDRPISRFIIDNGYNKLESAFNWMAFRYAQITVRNHTGSVIFHKVGMRTRQHPLNKTGFIKVDDPELENIREICEHTLRMCMQDGFLDSSSREQQQWIGDGRWQAVICYYLSTDSRLHRKMLEQIGQSQDWLGMVRPRHPDAHDNISPIPSFCLAWVCSFYDFYLYTSEKDLLLDWWPNIIHALRWFTAFENRQGLLENVPHWQFIDWGDYPLVPDVDRGGIITAINILYLEALNAGALIAELVSDKDAYDIYTKKALDLASSIRKNLWNPKAGGYSDCIVGGILSDVISEPANALAILYLHEKDDFRSGKILNSVFMRKSKNRIIPSSPLWLLQVCRALIKLEKPDMAMNIIRDRYGRMLDAGATTTWETWKLFTRKPDGRVEQSSASHGWGAAPLAFFAEGILGIKLLEPGFSKFLINPRLCGLSKASGAIPTPHGAIKINVEKRNDGQRIEISIPDGCTGYYNGKNLKAGSFIFDE